MTVSLTFPASATRTAFRAYNTSAIESLDLTINGVVVTVAPGGTYIMPLPIYLGEITGVLEPLASLGGTDIGVGSAGTQSITVARTVTDVVVGTETIAFITSPKSGADIGSAADSSSLSITPVSTATAPPAITAVGPAFTPTVSGQTSFGPGTYSGINVSQFNPTAAGTYNLTDMEIGYIPIIFPGVVFKLLRCNVNNSIYFETNSSGQGGHNGWTIKRSKVDGGANQAVRPKGSGTIAFEDSWFLTHGTPPNPDIHMETMQCLNDGANAPVFTSDRCAWSCQPIPASFGTPITAVLSIGHGASTITDSIVGYWNGSSWSTGGGAYLIYSGDNSVWVRPTLYHGPPFNSTDPSQSYFYPGHVVPTGSRLVSPTLL